MFMVKAIYLKGTELSLLDSIKGGISFGDVPDAYNMIIALGKNLDPIMTMIGACAYMVGVIFILSGVYQLKKAGMNENGSETPTKALVIMGIGILLIYLPGSINTLSITAFGSGSHNPLGYTQAADMSAKVASAMAVIYKFIGIAGIAAFVYGCVILKGTTEGRNDASLGKGMWHLIGGVGAIHLDYLVSIFRASAGFAS